MDELGFIVAGIFAGLDMTKTIEELCKEHGTEYIAERLITLLEILR